MAALEYASGKCAIGVGKPERAYFELVLKDLGLPAETVAMVGDDPELDVGGAQVAGLRGFSSRPAGTGRERKHLSDQTLLWRAWRSSQRLWTSRRKIDPGTADERFGHGTPKWSGVNANSSLERGYSQSKPQDPRR